MEKQEATYVVSQEGVNVEYPIGQELIINGKRCRVVADKNEEGELTATCDACVINTKTSPIECRNLACIDNEREDDTCVHFEPVED